MDEHPIEVRIALKTQGQYDDYGVKAVCEADSLEAAFTAIRTNVIDDGAVCDRIVIRLAPGYRFQLGELRYSADWL